MHPEQIPYILLRIATILGASQADFRTIPIGNSSYTKEHRMATRKQRSAARKNINNAAKAARNKRTIAHLPKATRTALGKQAAQVRHRGRG